MTGDGWHGCSQRPLDAALGGDAPALSELVDGLRPYLIAVEADVLQQRLEAKADASDVVQEAPLEAVDGLAQFHGHTLDQWRAWLTAIVRNGARKKLRYWRQGQRDVTRERSLERDGSCQLELAVDTSGPSRKALRRERAAWILTALAQLKQEHQEVIYLRNFEGLSHGQVAARMGRSERAARQLWRRALAHLHRRLLDDV